MNAKTLRIVDVVATTTALIGALVLGNAIVARHVPELDEDVPFIGRAVIEAQTGPASVAEWLLQTQSVTLVAYLLALAVAVEVALLLVLVRTVGTSRDRAEQKRALAIRAGGRLCAWTLALLVIGALASGAAWLATLVLNHDHSGVGGWIFLVTFWGVWLFATEILASVPAAVVGESA